MNNFYKWLILTCVYVALFVVLNATSFFAMMAAVDTVGLILCYSILGLTVFGIGWVLFQVLKSNKPHLKRVVHLGEMSMLVGILGSVIGTAFLFYNADITNIDAGNKQEIIDLMGMVSTGMGISLTTTIAGIMSALVLGSYIFVIKDHSND